MKNNNIKFILIFKLQYLNFKIFIIVFIFILISITFNYIYFFNFKFFKSIENYYKLCNQGILLNKNKYFHKEENPVISIISAIYNKEKYILRFIRSIQNQNFEKFEIFLIDDCSTDNTIKIIENLQKEDKRINLIKHIKKKGTLISRNDGIIKSKGKFLMILDPDDILLNDILNESYKLAKKYNYDIIRFNAYIGKKNIFMNKIIKDIINRTIYQPELSFYIFYGKGYLTQIDYVLWNKLIKREVYINALNSINNYYLNKFMIIYEDGLINYMLFKKAKSYYFMKNIGYYYIINKNSIMVNYKKNSEKIINNIFIYLEFLFQYTNNAIFEKNIASFVFINMLDFLKQGFFIYVTEYFQYYYKIINFYLNFKLIFLSIKNKFKNIEYFIENSEKKNNRNFK